MLFSNRRSLRSGKFRILVCLLVLFLVLPGSVIKPKKSEAVVITGTMVVSWIAFGAIKGALFSLAKYTYNNWPDVNEIDACNAVIVGAVKSAILHFAFFWAPGLDVAEVVLEAIDLGLDYSIGEKLEDIFRPILGPSCALLNFLSFPTPDRYTAVKTEFQSTLQTLLNDSRLQDVANDIVELDNPNATSIVPRITFESIFAESLDHQRYIIELPFNEIFRFTGIVETQNLEEYISMEVMIKNGSNWVPLDAAGFGNVLGEATYSSGYLTGNNLLQSAGLPENTPGTVQLSLRANVYENNTIVQTINYYEDTSIMPGFADSDSPNIINVKIIPDPDGINVVIPNGEETWVIGETKTIQWDGYEDTGSQVNIELSRNGGTTWELLSGAGAPNIGSFNWQVSGPVSGRCKFRVTSQSNGEFTDTSDDEFTIDNASDGLLTLTANPKAFAYCGWESSSLTATLKDSDGTPVSGAEIYFGIWEGDGILDPYQQTVFTDSQGKAYAVFWPVEHGDVTIGATVMDGGPLPPLPMATTTIGVTDCLYDIDIVVQLVSKGDDWSKYNVEVQLSDKVTGNPPDFDVEVTLLSELDDQTAGLFENSDNPYSAMTNSYGRMDADLTVSESGTYQITANADGTVMAVNAYLLVGSPPSLNPVRTIEVPQQRDVRAEWHPTNLNQALLAVDYRQLYFYDPLTGRTQCQVRDKDLVDVQEASYNDDGSTVAFFYADGQVDFWNSEGCFKASDIDVVNDHDQSFDFSPDGSYVAFITHAGDSLHVYHAQTGAHLKQVASDDHDKMVRFSPDGAYLAVTAEYTTGEAGWLTVYQTSNWSEKFTSMAPDNVGYHGIGWSPTSQKCAIGDDEGNIHIFDIVSGTIEQTIPVTNKLIDGADWSPDGKYIAVASASKGLAFLIDADTEQTLSELPHSNVLSVDWSPDSLMLITGGKGGTDYRGAAKIWAPLDDQYPIIENLHPTSGSQTIEPVVMLTGKITDDTKLLSTELFVNEISLGSFSLDSDGNFSKTIDLNIGVNSIAIYATDLSNHVSSQQITITRVSQNTLSINAIGTGTGQVEVKGAIHALPFSGSYATGSTIAIKALPSSDSLFAQWSGGATSSQENILVTLDEDLNIDAEFLQLFALNLSSDEGEGQVKVNGSIRSLPYIEHFVPGEIVNLEAIPDVGWLFSGWSGDFNGNSNPLIIEINSPKQILAHFNQQTGSLQVNLGPVGAVSSGAQWNVNGGVWNNSGDVADGIPVGPCTVGYKQVLGWATPLAEQIVIISDTTTEIFRNYTEDVVIPTVAISTNNGENFTTSDLQVILEGATIDSAPSSGLLSTAINTGASNEGTAMNWRFTVTLTLGANTFIITSTDNAGNIGIDSITIELLDPAPLISVTPSSHDFQEVAVGAFSEVSFIVSNVGNAVLNVSGLSISSTDADQFSIESGQEALSLDPGGHYSITIRFAPTSIGQKNGTLYIFSDDPNEPEKEVLLTGSANPSLLSEDWETGSIDETIWQKVGSPLPQISDQGRNGGYALNINGDNWCDSALYTKNDFSTDSGLLAEFALKGYPTTSTSGMGIKTGFTADLHYGSACNPSTEPPGYFDEIAGIYLDPQVGRKKLLYSTYDGQNFEAPYPGDDWHDYKIEIAGNGFVSFFQDGELIYTTPNPIDLLSYPTTKFQIKGRAKYGEMLADDIHISYLTELDTDNDGLPDDLENATCTKFDDNDSDGDGILDGIEDANLNGQQDENETDPCNPDSDGDGMPDGWEVDHSANPMVADAMLDFDNDGFSNLREFLSGSDPWNDGDRPGIIADFATDNVVDGSALSTLLGEFGRSDCLTGEACRCDVNGDGVVDETDLFVFSEDYGRVQ